MSATGLKHAKAGLAGFGPASQQVCVGSAVLSLGVGDGTVLLSQVEPQLTLVSEV